MTDQNTDIQNLSFEDALSALETIVKSLESGNIPLEESIQAYERGVALRQHCETRLKAARMRIEQISISPDGQAQANQVDIP